MKRDEEERRWEGNMEENVKAGAVNQSVLLPMNKFEVKEIHKQPLYLCKKCRTLLAYKSFKISETEKVAIFKAVINYRVREIKTEESKEDYNSYKVLCPGCHNCIGIKMVNTISIFPLYFFPL